MVFSSGAVFTEVLLRGDLRRECRGEVVVPEVRGLARAVGSAEGHYICTIKLLRESKSGKASRGGICMYSLEPIQA